MQHAKPGHGVRSFGVIAAALAISCIGAERIAVDQEAVVGGTDDVVIDRLASGTVFVPRDIRQRARDATVSVRANTLLCSGTLVSPRVVVTAAHCLDARGGGATTVRFSPIHPEGPGGPSISIMPPVVPIAVADCMASPGTGMTLTGGCSQLCPYTGAFNARNNCFDIAALGNDIAVLILSERVDIGLSGRRMSRYPVVPAHLREIDAGGVAPWLGTTLSLVGYGGTDFGGTPALRQTVQVTIEACTGPSCTIRDANIRGGDSGGSLYLPPEQPTGPRSLLCVPTSGGDFCVRVSHSAIQDRLLIPVLGPVAEHYPGAMVRVSTTGPIHPDVAGPPGSTTLVWTGDVDCPPTEEPDERAAFDATVRFVAAGLSTSPRTSDDIDPDGDGLAGIHDNCWGIHNPLQRITDPTLAGTGTDPTVSTSCIPRSAVIDATGVLVPPHTPQTWGCLPRTVVCRGSSPSTASEQDIDPDHDSIPTPCDNCPCANNPDQNDCDGDGQGDACENDRDGDRVPDDCDNCVTHPNHDQANCNIDAEVTGDPPPGWAFCYALEPLDCDRHRHECTFLLDQAGDISGDCGPGRMYDPPRSWGFGDACDPTPCGHTRITTRTLGGQVLMDQIETTPLAQDPTSDQFLSAGDYPGQRPGPGAYSTGYRVCPCEVAVDDTLGVRGECTGPVGHIDAMDRFMRDQSGDCTIHIPTTPGMMPGFQTQHFGEVPEPLHWRWPTIDAGRGGVIRAEFGLDYRYCDRLTARTILGLFGTAISPPTPFLAAMALGVADVPRWAHSPQFWHLYPIDWPGANPPTPANYFVDLTRDRFRIVLWTQTLGPTTPFSFPEQELTRGYWSGGIDAPLDLPIVLTPDQVAALAVPYDPRVCPRCAASFPTAFVGTSGPSVPPCPCLGCCLQAAFAGGAVPALALGASFASFAVPTVERWAVSADHAPYRQSEGLRAVGIGVHGIVIESLIAQHDQVFVDELLAGCPKRTCDSLTLPPSIARVLALDPPAPRDGYATTMSGTARRLWLAGGVDRSGTRLRDLWEYDLANQIWREFDVSSHGRLGAVLAVAWGSARHALYVLDRTPPRHADRDVDERGQVEHDDRQDCEQGSIRLLRVDPSGNDFVVERCFDAHPEGRFELAAGPEDELWVVRSRVDVVPGEYEVTRLVRDIPARARRRHDHRDDETVPTAAVPPYITDRSVDGRGGVVPGAVSADSRGLSLLVRSDRGAVPIGIPSARRDGDVEGRDGEGPDQ